MFLRKTSVKSATSSEPNADLIFQWFSLVTKCLLLSGIYIHPIAWL